MGEDPSGCALHREMALPGWAWTPNSPARVGVQSWEPWGHCPGPHPPLAPYPVSPYSPPLVHTGEMAPRRQPPGVVAPEGHDLLSAGQGECSLGHLGGTGWGRDPQAPP